MPRFYTARIFKLENRARGLNEPVPCLFLDRSFNSHRCVVRCIIHEPSYVDPGLIAPGFPFCLIINFHALSSHGWGLVEDCRCTKLPHFYGAPLISRCNYSWRSSRRLLTTFRNSYSADDLLLFKDLSLLL